MAFAVLRMMLSVQLTSLLTKHSPKGGCCVAFESQPKKAGIGTAVLIPAFSNVHFM
ncbi:MAG TPA: hypothetical protein VHO66_05005 [Ruminiclostridium sp.]|nr:hypothetical protein [Ruminiclostridium sp.]